MEEDLVDSRRFVLSGLDDYCPSDTISEYIHSCSHRAEHSWEAVGGDLILAILSLFAVTFFILLYSTLVKIKDVLIDLKKGNITEGTVKAIVNSTNEDVFLT